jgi:16S rRNA (guanine1207-N2)-methyltransferase/23S rRNA (guanine1835-N2)-methyltransferase
MSQFTQINCPQGSFDLRRLPHDPSDTLRAWDSADELLLQHITDSTYSLENVLILNDGFGALACALSKHNPVSMGDSFVSQLASQENLSRNQCSKLQFLSSTDALPTSDLILAKQTKNLRYFEYQLQQLAASQAPGTKVVIAGMQKYLSKGFLDTAADYLDDFSVSRAVKKARLLSGKIRKQDSPPEPVARVLDEAGITVYDTANVFAAGKLDIGSRFLLEHFPDVTAGCKLLDLGCGNGVLGLKAMQQGAEVHFVDESWMALKAVELALPETKSGSAFLHLSNCLQQYEGGPVDMILCNPPFHQQQAIAKQIAWQMFREAKAHLQIGGEFYVIANRHLGYHQSLSKLFGNAECIQSNNKFVLLKAIKK